MLAIELEQGVEDAGAPCARPGVNGEEGLAGEKTEGASCSMNSLQIEGAILSVRGTLCCLKRLMIWKSMFIWGTKTAESKNFYSFQGGN